MATLVLTTVGRAVGGSVGGAIGALIGQQADNALFGKAREGPRLTELAVQTSSYGTQIGRLFGTIRVAGTVIWSTDLIEARSRSGGKGSSGTNNYSYSASFAVLLSARPIVAVKRIWAEGKLLRGAAGDWKTSTKFRLHLGGEDQAADPLIASAEGRLTTAHRGHAYAMFEGLQLAAFGNRIPSLTFEVVADAGAQSVAAIARALAPEVEGEVATMLDGFSASGDSVGAVLDTLATAAGAWWGGRDDRLVLRDAAEDSVTLHDDGVTADTDGARRTRTIAALETVPREVTVAHYDPARDYQAGVQRARRPGAGQIEQEVEIAAVMSASAAKTIAARIIDRAEAARTKRTINAGIEAMDIAPGECVEIAGETGMWRVERATLEAMVTKLELVPLALTTSAVAAAASGRVAAAADLLVGTTIVHAFELPVLDDSLATTSRISVAACGSGSGWRQASLLYSRDDATSWTAAGLTAAPAIIGNVVVGAGAGSALLIDEAGSFEVVLARPDMALGDADDAAIDRGENLALIGDELVQFGIAEPLGAGRWRLRRLRRGRRGTEAAIGAQRAGDRFVLVEQGAITTIDLPAGASGGWVRILATGIGDAEAVAAATPVTGASIVPPAPVHLAAARASDGSVRVSWVRRSRTGWRWADAVDAPLGEEREAYAVTIASAGGEQIVETATPMLTLAAGYVPRSGFIVAVRQLGTWGASPAAIIELPAGAAA